VGVAPLDLSKVALAKVWWLVPINKLQRVISRILFLRGASNGFLAHPPKKNREMVLMRFISVFKILRAQGLQIFLPKTLVLVGIPLPNSPFFGVSSGNKLPMYHTCQQKCQVIGPCSLHQQECLLFGFNGLVSLLIVICSFLLLEVNPIPITLEVVYNWKKIKLLTIVNTLHGTNISHLGKRKIIFKYTLGGDMLVPRRVIINQNNHQSKTHPYFRKVLNFSFPPHRPFFSKLNIIFRSQNPTIGGQGGRHNGQQKKT